MAQKAGKGHSDGVFFFWTFHKQTPVLSVLSDSVASSLFYPSEKRGSLGMITKPLFFTPIWRQLQILLRCYILTLVTSLVQAPMRSCWHCCNLLLGLPFAAFIHSVTRERYLKETSFSYL